MEVSNTPKSDIKSNNGLTDAQNAQNIEKNGAVESTVPNKIKTDKYQVIAGDDLETQAALFQKLLSEGGAIPEDLRKAIADGSVLTGIQGVPTQLLNTMTGVSLEGIGRTPIADTSSHVSRIDQIAESVAKAILVSDVSSQRAVANSQEVLIVLKPEVLPGAQVNITRKEGALEIVFQTNVKDSALFLNQNQTFLQNTLATRLAEPTQVRIQEVDTNAMNYQSQAGQNDGRSRGYYMPQPEDLEN